MAKKLFMVILCGLFLVSCNNGDGKEEYDIDSVTREVKFNHYSIEKYLETKGDFPGPINRGTYTYTVKSRIDRFEIIYDCDNYSKFGDDIYIIDFFVIDTDNNTAVRDELVWIPEENTTGILLSFDDYYTNWDTYLPLFDEYEAKATFFVHGPYANARQRFFSKAAESGHEVGWHNESHPNLTTVDRATFDWETVGSLEQIKNDGFDIVSFAYPGGNYEDWMNAELLRTFKFTRGFDRHIYVYNIDDLKSGGFIFSKAIDERRYNTVYTFEHDILDMFLKVKFMGDGYVLPVTSHSITTDVSQGWKITPDHLNYLLATGKNLKLKFYRFKDMLE